MEPIEKKTIVQKLRKTEKDIFEVARRYYQILSAVNDLRLTERQIQLIAFTAIKGNISYSTNKEEFCKLYKSSPPTINNIVSELKKLNIFVKDASKIKVNPKILLNFENDIIIETKITLKENIGIGMVSNMATTTGEMSQKYG
jgi:CRISPR/Cas system CMR subunit Cmr6 (Cas7 group RAMP superfamily)